MCVPSRPLVLSSFMSFYLGLQSYLTGRCDFLPVVVSNGVRRCPFLLLVANPNKIGLKSTLEDNIDRIHLVYTDTETKSHKHEGLKISRKV